MIPIDQQLLQAVIKQESGGNPNAVSPVGAAGIMQIMPATAKDPGYGVTPLQNWDGKDPRTAPVEEQIRFGNDYLNAMKKLHGGNTQLALASYNAGPGAVQQYGGIPPYKETQDYVQKVSAMASNTQAPQLDIQWDEQPDIQMDTGGLDIQRDEQAPPTLGQKLQSNIQNRQDQMQKSADAYVRGEQSMPETMAQQSLSFASTVLDTLYTTAGHYMPQIAKDAGKKVFDTASFLAANTIGELPVGDGSGRKVREAVPQELNSLATDDTRFARNVRAVLQAANLYPTYKTLDLLSSGTTKVADKVIDLPGLKSYLTDTRTTQGLKASRVVDKAAQKTAAIDMNKLARESFDEAAYLNEKFTPEQVANEIDKLLVKNKPKPMANGILTVEDKELIKHLNEFKGHTGKQLTLDDIDKIDKSLRQKINKFVDTRTGELDDNGRKLYLLQKDIRNIVDKADTQGNNALRNGKNFYRAQKMMEDLDAVAERASMTTNPGKALQTGFRNLYNDKDRISGWPDEVKEMLKKAATPNGMDEALDFFGSRLPAIIGLGTGNLPGAATAHVAGIAARGAKEGVIAARGARVQQAIVNDTMKKIRPVDIPAPTVAEQLLLPSPGNMTRAPMTDTAIKQVQKQMNKPFKPGPDTSGTPIKTPVSQMTNLRAKLGKGKGADFEGTIQYFEQGSQSQNQFVKEMVRKFGLTQTQAKQLAKEIKTYGVTEKLSMPKSLKKTTPRTLKEEDFKNLPNIIFRGGEINDDINFFSHDFKYAKSYSKEGGKFSAYQYDPKDILEPKKWWKMFSMDQIDELEDLGPDLVTDPPEWFLKKVRSSGYSGYSDGNNLRIEKMNKLKEIKGAKK